MFLTQKSLSRRTFLRSAVGVSIGLPILDAMLPALKASQLPGKTPVRAAWFYVPNGIDMRHWLTQGEGPIGELPRVLKPFENLKKDILALSNLTSNWGRPLLIGAGDHGRACASYMAGVEVQRLGATDVRLGISADQIAAKAIGGQTKLPSLEMALEEARMAGNCDNNYSCAYVYNLAWRSDTQPLPPISEPRMAFERLFGTDVIESPAAYARRLAMRRSILDDVGSETQKLKANLGPTDRRKLDEFLTSVREIEKLVEKTEKEGVRIDPGMDKPFGIPPTFEEYFKLMSDMLIVAFKADLTRIATFMVGREGSTRSYREIGIPDGHHPLTHHMGNQEMLEKVCQINCYHAELFAAFLGRLKAVKEGDGNLLDNSMIVYGSGISDGNVHTHDQLPTLLCGKAGGSISPGRHIVYQRETPVSNLFASMLERMDVRPEHIGDSTGRLKGLSLS